MFKIQFSYKPIKIKRTRGEKKIFHQSTYIIDLTFKVRERENKIQYHGNPKRERVTRRRKGPSVTFLDD